MDTFDQRDGLTLDEDGLKTETDDGFGQDMSNKMDEGSSDADKMLNELQNPMSVAPPSVAPSSSAQSEYNDDMPPESPMSHFSHPPSPSHDSPPPSPLPRPPRPDTASSQMSMDAPPTPIAFGNVPRDCMTPMSQRSMTPQPMPDQPPTPISHYPDAPPSPMVQPQEPRIQHHPIQQPLSTNQLMNNVHQKSHQQPTQQPTAGGRMNLRERKEPPPQQYHSGMDQTEPVNSNRRRRVRRQLIIDQVKIKLDNLTIKFSTN